MSAENSPATSRGGCLDAGVKYLTFGYFGVETSYNDRERMLDVLKFEQDLEYGVMKTGQSIAANYNSTKPRITRKIVRNK